MTDFSPSYRGKVGTWCRSCFAAYMRGERVTNTHEARTCVHCGQQYVPRQLKAAAAYCSRQCKTKAKNAAEKAQRDAAKVAAPPRECPQCGGPVPVMARSDAVFCSQRCNAAAHGLRGKLKSRGVPLTLNVVRSELAKRDGWRCGICRKRINPALRWPDLMAGSLDHIVPVVEGGGSDPANLRIVHLTCNASRQHRGGNEQLAMFG